MKASQAVQKEIADIEAEIAERTKQLRDKLQAAQIIASSVQGQNDFELPEGASVSCPFSPGQDPQLNVHLHGEKETDSSYDAAREVMRSAGVQQWKKNHVGDTLWIHTDKVPQGFTLYIFHKTPPPTCHWREREVVTPEKREIVRELVCADQQHDETQKESETPAYTQPDADADERRALEKSEHEAHPDQYRESTPPEVWDKDKHPDE